MYPVHPASHPLSHTPVTWLQVMPSLQCPTHGRKQFTPYHPIPQANKNSCVIFFIPIHHQYENYDNNFIHYNTSSQIVNTKNVNSVVLDINYFLMCYENVTLLSEFIFNIKPS